MTAAPGKHCGPCTMCCSALEIVELEKPAGPLCKNCVAQTGCKIYQSRPSVCREFECEWLMSRTLPQTLSPFRTGVILMEADDEDEYRAVCAPERPMAWRTTPQVFKHLVATAKSGRVVVAKAGLNSWRIFATGEWGPTV
jgi:uncharacterized protein